MSSAPGTSAAVVGARVRKAREAKGMSQAALAEAIGQGDHSYISKIEHGRHAPQGDLIGRLSSALDMPAEDLRVEPDDPLSLEAITARLERLVVTQDEMRERQDALEKLLFRWLPPQDGQARRQDDE